MSTEKNTKVDKNSDKYKVILKLVNKILTNLGKKEIADLTGFIDIDREDIIKDENNKTLVEMEKEIFKFFDKGKTGYYRKSDTLILNCLRGLLKDLGYKFKNKKKEKSTYIDGKSYKRTHMIYSIMEK